MLSALALRCYHYSVYGNRPWPRPHLRGFSLGDIAGAETWHWILNAIERLQAEGRTCAEQRFDLLHIRPVMPPDLAFSRSQAQTVASLAAKRRGLNVLWWETANCWPTIRLQCRRSITSNGVGAVLPPFARCRRTFSHCSCRQAARN